jgi:hypothetical protein
MSVTDGQGQIAVEDVGWHVPLWCCEGVARVLQGCCKGVARV